MVDLFKKSDASKLKELAREHLSFLKDWGYEETSDPRLVLQGWQEGLCYTNGKKALVMVLDIREARLSTIVYTIQEDFSIPELGTEDYVVLDSHLQSRSDVEDISRYTAYRLYGLEKVVRNVADVLYAGELLT